MLFILFPIPETYFLLKPRKEKLASLKNAVLRSFNEEKNEEKVKQEDNE